MFPRVAEWCTTFMHASPGADVVPDPDTDAKQGGHVQLKSRLKPGCRVGPYETVRLLGVGYSGEVHEAVHAFTGQRVALKCLHSEHIESEHKVSRFSTEATTLFKLEHENVVRVLDAGWDDGAHPWMAMELLTGQTLGELLARQGRLSLSLALQYALDIAWGIDAAHENGIIHRDLKPDNVFVLKEKAGQRDYVKLIDFGISKFQQLGGEMKMTRTGTVMGTPYYMSPEQASGSREADRRSDLYAVGVMLYEAVTGRVPFDAPTFNQLLFQIVLSEPPSPLQVVPDLDPAFATLIGKAMARDVEQRFQTALELAQALDAWWTTGASVSIPITAVANPHVRAALASQPLIDAQGRPLTPAFGASPAQGTSTGGSWASSQMDASSTRSRVPLLLAAVGGVIVMAVGVAALMLLMHRGAPSTVASSVAAVSSPAVPSSPAIIAGPEPSGAQVDAAAAAATAARGSTPVATTAPKPAQPAASPHRAAVTPKPLAKPAEAPSPKVAPRKASTPSGSDFGY